MTMNQLLLTLAAAAATLGYIYTLKTHRDLATQLERHHMSTQAAIDAVVAQLVKAKNEIVTKLTEATADVQEQLSHVAGGEEVDLSALTAIAQQLDDLVPDTAAVEEPTDEVVDEAADEDNEDNDDDVAVDEPVETGDDTDETTDEPVETTETDDNGELIDLTDEADTTDNDDNTK